LPFNIDTETGTCRRFGNGDGKIGGRIAPVLSHLAGHDFGRDDPGSDILGKQIELEADNAIRYRSYSWEKTAFLLFSEYSSSRGFSFLSLNGLCNIKNLFP
jgi:hypothetical protein